MAEALVCSVLLHEVTLVFAGVWVTAWQVVHCDCPLPA
jgi:hypothetical protein